jgi:uncharacterized membrane protein (UPF0127 family)
MIVMKKFLLAAALIITGIILISIGFQEAPQSSRIIHAVQFRNVSVNVEIASTESERQVGLMYRTNLSENAGMLFVFGSDGYYSFWMKNTLIPLDMIWINNNLTVVHIDHATPCTQIVCQSYRSNASARYVLEVNGEFTDRHDIKVGDSVELSYSV